MIRNPAVAGYFYPADPRQLSAQLSELVPEREKTDAVAVVVPHAGYKYSGHVAGEVYSRVALPDTFVILCPNHTGAGSDLDLYPEGEWRTPLGSVAVDSDMWGEIQRLMPRITVDGRAHVREHSLEVQLPFLQFLKQEEIQFLPICIATHDFRLLQDLALALAEMIRNEKRKVLVIASSDMTHYETQEAANRKDRLAIEPMLRVDAQGLYHTVNRYQVSMCGYLPATVALLAAQVLGATAGDLAKYATSGDVTGDYTQVVGYAGVIIR